MHPTELNALMVSITNHLYCNLTEKEFANLGLFLSILSRDMLSMETVRKLCEWEEKDGRRGRWGKREKQGK